MQHSILWAIAFIFISCQGDLEIKTGADQTDHYLSLLEGKNIGVVANHTSCIGKTHLVDSLRSRGITISRVFAPEHGFRGTMDAGTKVDDEIDTKTGIPIVSLYGAYKKPRPEDLVDIDMLVFDIQDVGVRFFTYISTLHYVMEACAESDIPLLVLDRPNPNGGFIDGPVLELEHQSFVGMHRIPVVYGMTIGELAQMINGEGWLNHGQRCELKVIRCDNYKHACAYTLPVSPSPNLPNQHAVLLYPSTCFFEGTVLSEGRGTIMPFEVFGHPDLPGNFSFTPVSMPGMSTYPKLEGRECHGTDLRNFQPEKGWNQLFLHWLIGAYKSFPDQENFFIPFFEKLSGTNVLREQIESGLSVEEIRASWQEDLEKFTSIRDQYLLYK